MYYIPRKAYALRGTKSLFAAKGSVNLAQFSLVAAMHKNTFSISAELKKIIQFVNNVSLAPNKK